MKNYFTTLLFLVAANVILAQNDIIKQYRKLNDESKSGNYKDVLTNLFQLGTSNLTGDNKSIELNSTLFGIKTTFDNSILEDKIFVKERFSRNFQINAKVNLDDQFKYKGFTGGITYAIINDRDKNVANFAGTELDLNLKFLTEELGLIQVDFVKEISLDDPNREAKIEALDQAFDILINKEVDKGDTPNIYFEKFIVEFEKRNKSIKLKDHINTIHELRKNAYSEIEKKPLWTVSLLGTTNDKGDNQKVSFGNIFLKGFKHLELDIRSTLIYSDTLIETSLKRMESKSSAGLNYKMFRRGKESVFEVKLYMEYNSVLKNLFIDEKKDTFLASSDIRIRVTDDVWIPLTIKYDIENSNFLGFLNIIYNFGNSDAKGDLKLNKL